MSQPQFPIAPPSATLTAPKGSNGLAVAGFVLGLLGALGSFIPIVNIGAIVLAVIGLVLAGIGLARARAARAGRGMAIAGLILSVLAIIIAIIIDVAIGDAFNNATSNSVDTSTVATPSASTSAAAHGEGKTAPRTDLGTSRANPAPLGSAISGGDWTVRINSVKTAKSDSLGQSAPAGKTLLLINMTATYTGSDPQGDSSFATVKYVAADGTSYDDTSGKSLFIPNDAFNLAKTLYHGGTETGNDLIEIPAADWKAGVLAVSPGLLNDDTFVSLK